MSFLHTLKAMALAGVVLGAALWSASQAQAALMDTVKFGTGANIIDSDGDGTFDSFDATPGARSMFRAPGVVEFLTVAEFDMNDLAGNIGASSLIEAGAFLLFAIFSFQLNNFPFSDCGGLAPCPTPNLLDLRGYVGNGTYETADATAGTIVTTISMIGAVARVDIDTDITAFVRAALLNSDPILGFGLAVPAGDSGGYPLFLPMQLRADGGPPGGDPNGIPEPGALLLFGFGLFAIAGMALPRGRSGGGIA